MHALVVVDVETGIVKRRIAGLLDYDMSQSHLAVDQRRHEYVIVLSKRSSLFTFARSEATTDVAYLSTRRMGPLFGDGIRSIVADRSRDELYVSTLDDPTIYVLSTASGAVLRRLVDPARRDFATLLFDPVADRLLARDDRRIYAYDRPTGNVLTPVHIYEIEEEGYPHMALDEQRGRLFVNIKSRVYAYDLRGTATAPFSYFDAILPPGWTITGRPAVTITVVPSLHRLAVHNNQIFASIHTGMLAVFQMAGPSMMPVNLPNYRLLQTTFGPSTAFVLDGRDPGLLIVEDRDRLHVYAPGFLGGLLPLRTITPPIEDVSSLQGMAICR